jgi:uncharacterized protein YgbK (DUF1537 family)
VPPQLGVIADDYTGAADIAGTLSQRGYRTTLYLGLPDADSVDGAPSADAVVIGIKTRSGPVGSAVTESLAALRTLRALGCGRYFHKYCATFDSTPEGNIGPVIDALMADLETSRTVAVLPFPELGRTVYCGHLFVNGVRLDESSMRHHPLTPMTDSRVSRLLEPQTRSAVREILRDSVVDGLSATRNALSLTHDERPTIFVLDAIERADLDVIAEATKDWVLVTGGSGLAASFPVADADRNGGTVLAARLGFRAVLCGSASAEAQAQVQHAKSHLAWFKLRPDRLRSDYGAELASMAEWAARRWAEDPAAPVMFFSVEAPEDLVGTGGEGAADTSALVESAMADLAVRLEARGLTDLIVGGGETSGSVSRGLDVTSMAMDAPLSPALAWGQAYLRRGGSINLLLKSGRLGALDLFLTAWDALPTPDEGLHHWTQPAAYVHLEGPSAD